MQRVVLLVSLFGCLAAALVAAKVPAAAALSGLPAGFMEDPPITSLSAPIAFDWTPDGRLFVGERGGNVRVVKQDLLLPTPAVTIPVNTFSERGLLGLAIDPRFPAHPYLYLYYTTNAASPKNRVSRFLVHGDTASGEEILVDNIPSDAGNHNGGDVHFGVDGVLYVSTGDGGNHPSPAQDLSSLAGKILRVDPDTGADLPDNPFFATCPQAACDTRIWAYGLRNPFRFAMHRATGEMVIADVGAALYDELDRGRAGANYGWPLVEGLEPPSVAGVEYPFFAYRRDGFPDPSFQGCRSIIGGGFVRGPNFPGSYAGHYFFGDVVCGKIWHMTPGAAPRLFASEVGFVAHLAFGPDGGLYYSDLGAGQVKRIRYAGDGCLPLGSCVYLPVVIR